LAAVQVSPGQQPVNRNCLTLRIIVQSGQKRDLPPQDTDQKPSREIWTFNNFLRECHGGAIAAGSHTGAGIGSMLVEDNVLNHSDMPFRFKSAPVNGGGIYDVLIRDCAVGDAQKVFTFNTTYSDANQAMTVEPADKPAEFYNIDAFRRHGRISVPAAT